ncbi:hypothetical protein ONZ45_g7278 [Pleurotus djamor]|nr:hypothetical protein ONZ45_g7278 [Pleurotus djamor]
MSSLDISPSTTSTLSGFYSYTDTLKGVYYGPGSLKTALPSLLKKIGGTKALVVTGKSLHEKTNVVRRVEAVLKEENAYGGTFHDIGQHSPIAGIRAGMDMFKQVQADIIVSVGGGSPVDASKAMLYFLHEEGGPQSYQIAIPTTLSAAEYSIGAGYTNEEGFKVAVSSQSLAPAGIILDAELTLATPARLWLSTGIRSLDHTVETLYRPLVPHPVKILCYSALADLFKYLPLSRDHPENVEYRQWLQIASWMSLWPTRFEKYSALGLSHALGHKLGARYSIPHGITSCLTLSPTVNLMAETASEIDKQYLAKTLFYLGQPSTGSLEGDVRKLSALIHQLVVDLGLESKLSQYKVPKADFPSIAAQALGTKDDPIFDKVIELLEGID